MSSIKSWGCAVSKSLSGTTYSFPVRRAVVAIKVPRLDWSRRRAEKHATIGVTNLDEPLARRLHRELSQSERSDFPVITEDSRSDSEKLKSLCEEWFGEITVIVRHGKDQHPETVYDENNAELQRWLTEYSG